MMRTSIDDEGACKRRASYRDSAEFFNTIDCEPSFAVVHDPTALLNSGHLAAFET